MTRQRLCFSLLLLASTCASTAAAQSTRTTTNRARMELSFDHGAGPRWAGDVELAPDLSVDLRLYTPEGFGGVLRFGAVFFMSPTLDLGIAQRFDLVAGTRGGLQLALAAGASASFVVTSQGWGYSDAPTVGGFAMANLDVWHRGVFFGLGVLARVTAPLDDLPGDPSAVVSVTPLLRMGGDWGL